MKKYLTFGSKNNLMALYAFLNINKILKNGWKSYDCDSDNILF